MRNLCGSASCLALFALTAGCTPIGIEADPGTTPGSVENKLEFQPRLRELAASYESFARVDDELHWAPFLCRMPQPSFPRRSASTQIDTHGRKLYYVFAKDRAAYLGRDGKQPGEVGQAVIKEAWEAEEVPADTQIDASKSPVLYLREGERLYHARQKAGLFVMYRLAKDTPGTDEGWVYGTVAADGKTVTAAGRVASCMGCHQQATHERLFGIDYHGS